MEEQHEQKRVYSKPSLRRYGQLSMFTTGGSGADSEFMYRAMSDMMGGTCYSLMFMGSTMMNTIDPSPTPLC